MSSADSAWRGLLRHLTGGVPAPFVSGWFHPLAAGFYCPTHSHRSLEIVYHRTGAGTTRLGMGETIPFDEGGAVLYAPEEPHDQRMRSAGDDLCVHVQIPAMFRLRLRGALHLPRVEDSLLAAEIESLALLPAPTTPSQKAALHHRATAVLLTLLGAAFQRPGEEPPGETRVRRAEEYIKLNFSRIGTLREVAGHAGVSPDHLRHLFQARRGSTLVRHLNEVRVTRACSLLVHSNLATKEIAQQCGFRDVYYFSTVFRRLRRSTPGRYRVRHRSGSAIRFA